MALKDLANVVISTEGPALSQVGFGTLLCATCEADSVFDAETYTESYTELAEAVTAGFAADGPTYRMLQRAFSQDPRPTLVKVGKLETPWTQVVKFKLAGAAANTTIYGFTMVRGAVEVDITYTSDGSALISEIVAGLAAAVEASAFAGNVAAIGTADTNTACQITGNVAGEITYYKNWTANLTFEDTTANPGIATDLATIRDHDSDWYGLAIDLNANAIAQAASGYIETLDAMFFTNSSDSKAYDSGVTADLGKALMTLSTGRTVVGFDLDDTSGYMGVAMAAERFPFDPGQDGAGGTFHGKTLSGVTADALTPTQKINLRAKNYVVYITTASRNHTLDGKVSGGEFADVGRGLDWFKIRTEERIAAAILDNQKIPYTDRGISIIKSCLDAQGLQAEAVELFNPGSFSSSAPARSATSSVDRAARKLTGLKFTASLAGAIHLVDPVSGSVTH